MVSLSLSGRWVSLQLTDGSQLKGYVHAVDFDTNNLLLLAPTHDGDATCVTPTLVFGHAVAKAARHGECVHISDDATLRPLGSSSTDAGADASDKTPPPALGPAALARRRRSIVTALEARRVPHGECDGGGIVAANILVCMPPYTSESCLCENEIVLQRFISMLEGLDSLERRGDSLEHRGRARECEERLGG